MDKNVRYKKQILLIVALALVCGVGLIVYVTGLLDYIPRLRASAQSPDGELTVRVYQQRLAPGPVFARMGAVAKIYDRGGNLVYEDIIFHDDDWDDTVGDAYKRITFEGNEILIGPGFYDSRRAYIIRKADLRVPK
jgi:hypothetical protein